MFVKLIEYAITIDNIEFVDPNFFFWLVLPIPIRLIQLDRSFVYLSTLLCVRVRFFLCFKPNRFPSLSCMLEYKKQKSGNLSPLRTGSTETRPQYWIPYMKASKHWFESNSIESRDLCCYKWATQSVGQCLSCVSEWVCVCVCFSI